MVTDLQKSDKILNPGFHTKHDISSGLKKMFQAAFSIKKDNFSQSSNKCSNEKLMLSKCETTQKQKNTSRVALQWTN
jgi:hypothetical protein